MRIDLHLGNIYNLEHLDRTRPGRSEGDSTALTEQAGQDSISGSSIRSATVRAMAEPEVRSERVQQLREAIASGNYKPVPVAIAGAMIEELR